MNGVTASEFTANTVILQAWKATVAQSCDKNQPGLLRVDITSVEDILVKRLLSAHRAAVNARTIRARKLSDSKTALVHFQVSYTQQDYSTKNITSTTQMMKTSYVQSVQSGAFSADFVVEVEKRTNESQVIVATVQPSVVTLETAYKVVETTDAPSFRPTAQPSTGTFRFKASTLLKLYFKTPLSILSFARCSNAVLEGIHSDSHHLHIHLRYHNSEHHLCPRDCLPWSSILHRAAK